MSESQPTRLVSLSDVLEIVAGVAPPDGYYHAGDGVRIQAWQQAIDRAVRDLQTFLGGDHE